MLEIWDCGYLSILTPQAAQPGNCVIYMHD